MRSTTIHDIRVRDVQFALPPGAGTDAVHSDPKYAYAVTELATDGAETGTGLALTLGQGNDLVCSAIRVLAESLNGREIEELMASFGSAFREMAEHPQLRWLGPHKGVVHLALASITNACFDLWAKSRGLPLWRLLLDLSPTQIVDLLDLSYVEDVFTREAAVALIEKQRVGRPERECILSRGYPAYDTSVGWFGYTEQQVKENARRALGDGFRALKLKVGSSDMDRDVRRASILREAVGDDVAIMLDANQQWPLSEAIRACLAFEPVSPYWIEEPTHPDDVLAHQTLSRAIAPIPVALGEHVPNRVMFKNFLQAQAANFVQADCTRVGGVSELITVSLLALKFGVPVAPHAGEMGQIHQHLVLFNRVALGLDVTFLEYIPHLREFFTHPVRVSEGRCLAPEYPGSGAELNGMEN